MCLAWQQNVEQPGEVQLCIDINDPYVRNVMGRILVGKCFCWSTPGPTGIFFPRFGNHIWVQGLSAINAVASLSREEYCYFLD